MLATIARFCVRRRRWVLAAWMLLFIAGITIGSMVFGRLHDSNGGTGTESVQGSNLMQQASSMGPTAVVLVKGPPVEAPGTRAAVLALTARLEKVPDVTGAANAYTGPAGRALRSPDGTAYSSIADLPIPASPRTTSAPPTPQPASASTRSITAHSRSRPSSCTAGC